MSKLEDLAYKGNEKVAPLVRQLPWAHHLIILGQSKRPEEREFYVRLAIRERWGKRELERQLRAAAFERAVLGPSKMSPVVAQVHPEALSIFKDSSMVEFLLVEFLDNDTHRVRYPRRPFRREPDLGATSVNYDFADLLARAEEPQ